MSFHHSPKIVTDGLVFYVNPSSKKCYNGPIGAINSPYKVNDLTDKNRYIGSSNGFQSDGSLIMAGAGNQTIWWRDFANVSGKTTYMCSFYLPPTNAFIFGLEYPFIFSSYDGSDGFAVYFNASNSFTNGYITFGAQAGGIYEEVGYDLPTSNSSGYNKIYTVAGTADNGVLKLYINGRFTTTVTNASLSSTNSLSLVEIGSSSLSFSDTNGLMRIYSSMIYNRALTDQEVFQNYNALKGKYKL